jgi:putative endonuclease
MRYEEQPWLVYLLECADGKFYTGMTPDLEGRLAAHQAGRGCDFTRRRLPVKLVYFERHASRSEARKREIEIKKWGQRRKRALIQGPAGFPRFRSG